MACLRPKVAGSNLAPMRITLCDRISGQKPYELATTAQTERSYSWRLVGTGLGGSARTKLERRSAGSGEAQRRTQNAPSSWARALPRTRASKAEREACDFSTGDLRRGCVRESCTDNEIRRSIGKIFMMHAPAGRSTISMPRDQLPIRFENRDRAASSVVLESPTRSRLVCTSETETEFGNI